MSYEIIEPENLKDELKTLKIARKGKYDGFINAVIENGAGKMNVEKGGQGRGLIHRAKTKFGLKGHLKENEDKTYTVVLYKPELIED